jgi:hypothetical protein
MTEFDKLDTRFRKTIILVCLTILCLPILLVLRLLTRHPLPFIVMMPFILLGAVLIVEAIGNLTRLTRLRRAQFRRSVFFAEEFPRTRTAFSVFLRVYGALGVILALFFSYRFLQLGNWFLLSATLGCFLGACGFELMARGVSRMTRLFFVLGVGMGFAAFLLIVVVPFLI